MKKALLILILSISLYAHGQTYFSPGVPPSSTSFTPSFRFNGTDSLANFYISNSNRWSLVYTAAQQNNRFVQLTPATPQTIGGGYGTTVTGNFLRVNPIINLNANNIGVYLFRVDGFVNPGSHTGTNVWALYQGGSGYFNTFRGKTFFGQNVAIGDTNNHGHILRVHGGAEFTDTVVMDGLHGGTAITALGQDVNHNVVPFTLPVTGNTIYTGNGTVINNRTVFFQHNKLTLGDTVNFRGEIIIDPVNNNISLGVDTGNSAIYFNKNYAFMFGQDYRGNGAAVGGTDTTAGFQLDTLNVNAYSFIANSHSRHAYFTDNLRNLGVEYPADYSANIKHYNNALTPWGMVKAKVDSLGTVATATYLPLTGGTVNFLNISAATFRWTNPNYHTNPTTLANNGYNSFLMNVHWTGGTHSDSVVSVGLDSVASKIKGIIGGSFVPYTGATGTVNLGSQELKTTFVPSTGADVINLTYFTGHAGAGTVTSVATGYGLSGGPITASGTLLADTSLLGTKTWAGKFITAASTNTVTNKSISGSTNTFSNIGNAALSNSAITLNSVSTSLGGSFTVTKLNTDTTSTGFATNSKLSTYLTKAQVVSSFYGTLYNKTTWANLSDFTNNGANASISSSHILFSGNGSGNTYAVSEDYNYYTCLDRWNVTATVVATSKSSTSYGIGVGLRSYSTGSAKVDNFAYFDASTGANSGTVNLVIFGNKVASSSALSWSAGDIITISCQRNLYNITATVRNVTTSSAPISISYTYISAYVSSPSFLHNTGKFGIFDMGATGNSFTLNALNIYSQAIENSSVMAVGDSKSAGYDASFFYNGWMYKLQANVQSIEVNAGPADQTQDVINRLSEIVALKPQQVLLCIGYNDIGNGVSSTVWHANIATIYNTLTSAGIIVTFLNSIYDNYNGLGWSATLASYINSTYPSNLIDTYTPGSNQPGTVNTSDNIHPSDFGSLVVYNTIVNSGKLVSSYNLQDAVNNVIISNPVVLPYLPLTAGSTVPITGNLYTQGFITNSSGITGGSSLTINYTGTSSSSGYTNIESGYNSVGFTAPLVINKNGAPFIIGNQTVANSNYPVDILPATRFQSNEFVNGFLTVTGNNSNDSQLIIDYTGNSGTSGYSEIQSAYRNLSFNAPLYLNRQGGNIIIGDAGFTVNMPALTASQAIFEDASHNLTSNSISGTGSVAMTTTPVFVTNITTPLILGGTGVTSAINLQSTSGNATTTVAAINFLGGNNGATNLGTILNNGQWQIGGVPAQSANVGITSTGISGANSALGVFVFGKNTSTGTSINTGNTGEFIEMDDGSSGTAGMVTAFGTYAVNRGSGSAIGTYGVAYGGLGTGNKFGIIGRATPATSGNYVGGYFDLQSSFLLTAPSLSDKAALIADNGGVSGASVFIGKVNGTTVLTLNSSGNLDMTKLFSFAGTAGTSLQIPQVNSGATAMQFTSFGALEATLITGTPTIVAGTGAGTGPTVSVTTNGKQLQVTVTTGTLPTGTNATIATVTLPNALTYTPYPVFSGANANTSLLSAASMVYMTSTGTANLTITSGTTALTAATTYVWNVTL